MYVSEIYDEAKNFCKLVPEYLVFRYLTNAAQILSNKGDFEILFSYLTIPVVLDNIVTLPREVKTVIKVNIDGEPSFSRDRLYEFSLNSPGSDTEREDVSWEDRGTVPTMVQVQPGSVWSIAAAAENPVDLGKNITIYGKDINGVEISDVKAVGASATATRYVEVTRIKKDVTAGIINLNASDNGAPIQLVSRYYPDETEPVYRQIRLSQSGVTARILFKRHAFKIISQEDFISVRSKMGLLYMIKALRLYENNDIENGDKAEAVAIKFATEEQKSWQSFIELAGATEVQPTRGLNINNRDSVIAADVFDDAARIYGPIGTPKIFDKMTEAVELLSNKGQWDGLVGSVDIRTDQFHYVTLPRYVEEILALNVCGQPTVMINPWFEFHLNGPGGCHQPCGTWKKIGTVVTFRDVNYSQKLVAVPDLASDTDTPMRGYGYYQGKRIMTLEGGKMVDGFPITVNMSGAVASETQFVDRIDRITKGKSNGFIKLLGFDASNNLMVTIGYYWPDETEPRYTRIRLNQQSASVRIRYRKRTLKVTSLTDPLHLESKTAIVRMMAALKLLDDGKYQEAGIEEATALRLLEEEQRSSNPLHTPELEFADTGENMSNFVV